MTRRFQRWPLVSVALTAMLIIAGCTTGGSDQRADQIILAEGQELGDYNPLLGYGQLGVSPIYDGLLRPEAPDDIRVPDLVPALAADSPERVAPRTWRVPLRTDITFSDGSALDADDVVATYRAVVDPAVAAPIATSFAPIVQVAADGPNAVAVTMATDADPAPYLLLGIIPSEAVEAAPAAEWSLNTAPVGTGAYVLDDLRPDQAVLVARDDYWGDRPGVRRIVYSYVPDDNARAQRIRAGEVDGANLPPALVESLGGQSAIETFSVRSADWRGISLPRRNAFTSDPQARLAMNLGVDREAVVREVLRGHGEPASTPVSEVYGEAYDPAAQFAVDTAGAQRILDAAGWREGADGVRSRGGVTAEFALLYNAQDTLRRDLAVAFAASMNDLGVRVTPRGTSWDDIDTQLDSSAVVLGGGETPYSLDAQLYDTLHTRIEGSSPYANPGNFTAPGMDERLDAARVAGPEASVQEYRELQRIYVEQPSQVFIAFLHHTYVATNAANWSHPGPILEPHSHGVSWGPWWNIAAWQQNSSD